MTYRPIQFDDLNTGDQIRLTDGDGLVTEGEYLGYSAEHWALLVGVPDDSINVRGVEVMRVQGFEILGLRRLERAECEGK